MVALGAFIRVGVLLCVSQSAICSGLNLADGNGNPHLVLDSSAADHYRIRYSQKVVARHHLARH